jgi:spore germination protein GerM
MRSQRLIALAAVCVVAGLVVFVAYRFMAGRVRGGAESIVVYYTKTDGITEVPWRVTLGPARDRKSVAFYAAAQALAGPATDVEAIRFPAGTHVRALEIAGSVVDVDLSNEVSKSAEGGLAETAEFKSLVWTLTDPKTLPGVDAVRIRVDGTRVATLPGGHFELDEPLSRTTF